MTLFEAPGVLFGAMRDLLRTWPRLLATGLVFKLLAFVLLTPLVGLTLRRFVSLSGNTLLADQDILLFVLSPLGIVALIVVAAAVIAISAFEQAGLMTIVFGAIRGRRTTVGEALGAAARHGSSIPVLTVLLVARVLLVAVPFLLAAGVVYWLLLTEFDINYYLTARPASFWFAGILIAGLLLAMSALVIPRLVGWIYALPIHLFEDVSAAKALRASDDRARGQRSAISVILVGWATFAVLLSALGVALVHSLGSYLVPRFQESIGSLLFVMGGLVLLWSLVNLFVTLFQAATFALLTVRLYDRLGESEAAKPLASPEEPLVSTGGFRLSAGTVLVVLSIGAALCGVFGYYLLERLKIEREVIAIGHRGAAGRAPENTLASVDAAIEDGADLVEVDVQETRDGQVVVIHDSDFMKLAGVGTKIWDASYDEARAIDIGSWFGPDFASERIPTLEEVLHRCKGRARVNIELKYYGHDQRLEERVVEIVEGAGMARDVVVMSLKQNGIRKVRELRPGWTIGLLMAKGVGDPTKIDADFLAVHTGLASRRFIRAAHRAGKQVYVWTVNDPVNMSRMIGRGVDGVITDDPALLNRVMERSAELSSPERLLLEAAFWMGMVPKDPKPEADLDPEALPAIGSP